MWRRSAMNEGLRRAGLAGWVIVLLACAAAPTRAADPAAAPSPQPPYEGRDVFADAWVATDALGRVVPGHAEVGPPRAGKFVGIFYWTWHHGTHGAYDVTKILAEAARTGGEPQWGPVGVPHHWG